MKKLLGILVLGLLWCNISFADQDYRIKNFTQWLYENGHNQYLEKDSDGRLQTNLKIRLNKKKRPLDYQSNPNRDTLLYYLWDQAYGARIWYEVKPSKKPYEFKFNLIEDKFVKKQMKTKGIMSYLYFQDGHILIDEISPKERLGEFINNETKFYSMSMSKSVVSYILGHAICDGYIDGVDARINDWPAIENTLYHNQKLIDFLNMSTGDQKYINEFIRYTELFWAHHMHMKVTAFP